MPYDDMLFTGADGRVTPDAAWRYAPVVLTITLLMDPQKIDLL